MRRRKRRTLAQFPTLVAQFHPTRNGGVRPEEVTAGSGRVLWWKCEQGPDHEWQCAASYRTGVSRAQGRGTGCPFCASRKLSVTNSLAHKFPEVARRWHPTRNGRLTPHLVMPGSNRKVWWKCPRGREHEWQAKLSSQRQSGCPFCARQRVTTATSLARVNPRLAREWHPTRNGLLTPRDVRPRSARRVWWQCRRNPQHEWTSTVDNRTHHGCPVCAGRRVSKATSLLGVAPAVARQFHPTKNGVLRAEDLSPGSEKRVWWKCPKGPDHEWQTRVYQRGRVGRGCPFCAGNRISVRTSLLFRALGIAAEWHPTRNGTLTPRDVGIGSNRAVWWQCIHGHEWEGVISVRARVQAGCPFCQRRKAAPETSLAVTHPALARQWHPTKNRGLTPYDVLSGAHHKVWWKCPAGPDHEWAAIVSSRTRSGDACPYCLGFYLSVTNSVAALAPQFARWWHPTKNAGRRPQDVRLADTKLAWWKCPEGPDHEWQRAPNGIKRTAACPFCINRRLSVTNCLATQYPKAARFWHPKKNGRVTPDAVIANSTHRYWWRCDRGHEWQASAVNRTRSFGDCPFCRRRRQRQATTGRRRERVYLPADFSREPIGAPRTS